MAAAKWDDMNQYERDNARMKVDGYRIVRKSSESDQEWFERSKADALAALDKQRAQVACMTFENMFPRSAATQGGSDGS